MSIFVVLGAAVDVVAAVFDWLFHTVPTSLQCYVVALWRPHTAVLTYQGVFPHSSRRLTIDATPAAAVSPGEIYTYTYVFLFYFALDARYRKLFGALPSFNTLLFAPATACFLRTYLYTPLAGTWCSSGRPARRLSRTKQVSCWCFWIFCCCWCCWCYCCCHCCARP